AGALPVFFVIGMTRTTVIAGFAVAAIGALVVLWRGASRGGERVFAPVVVAALLAAALLAFAVASAILPKVSSAGVALAAPIFDHAKIAMVDEMVRQGVPPANPFFAAPSRLAYYYLWHFSAAELAVVTGVSGWAADAALTWFTAFASLGMMIGLAVW